MEKSLLSILARRYPQLAIPIADGMSKSETYRNAVARGESLENEPCFRAENGITLETAETPAGPAEVLFLPDREDFIHAYRALGYHCEPADIPDSVGAAMIDGLIDWGKIRDHQKQYEAAGHDDWPMEFLRFTQDKKNYRNALILLSSGTYSAIAAEEIGMEPEEWREKSVIIRKYHELCHFVCRKHWPEKKNALRDEIYADCTGLLAAFGKYDSFLARLFLGIEKADYRKSGRLSHYIATDLEDAIIQADNYIAEVEEKLADIRDLTDFWSALQAIY